VLQGVAKLMSKHIMVHSNRVHSALSGMLEAQKDVITDVNKITTTAHQASASVATSVMEWSREATSSVSSLLHGLSIRQSDAMKVFK
jgi:hypothetical protein